MSKPNKSNDIVYPFMKEISTLVQGSPLDMKNLIDNVHTSLTSNFLPGEKVQLKCKINGQVSIGEVIRKSHYPLVTVEDGTSIKNKADEGIIKRPIFEKDLAKYDVRFSGNIISAIPSPDLIRCTPIPDKADIKSFLKSKAKFEGQCWSLRYGDFEKGIVGNSTPMNSGFAAKRKLSFDLKDETIPERKIRSAKAQAQEKIKCTLTPVKFSKLKQKTMPEMMPKVSSCPGKLPLSPVKVDNNKVPNVPPDTLQVKTIGTVNDSPNTVKNTSRTITPLPESKKISIIPEISSSIIGDCFFVSEFIGFHAEVLRTSADDNIFPISAGCLMDALALGQRGFVYLNSLIICLLRVLCQEMGSFQILKMELESLPVSIYSASELTRLILDQLESDAITDVLEALKTQDICELEIAHKSSVLVFICHLLFDCNTIIDFRQKKISDAMIAREDIRQMQIGAEEEELKMNKENLQGVVDTEEVLETDSEFSMSATLFYGDEDASKNKKMNDSRLRRIESLKAAREKKRLEKLEREKRHAEERHVKTIKKLKKAVDFGNSLNRIDPMGIDRDGSCYWLLMHSGFGLIVESAIEKSESDRNGDNNLVYSEPSPIVTWSHYHSVDQVKILQDTLGNSFFETERRMAKQLVIHNEAVSKVLNECSRRLTSKVQPRDGIVDSIEELRTGLINLDEQLFINSLVLVNDRDEWIKRVTSAQTPFDFANCILHFYFAIPLRILRGSVWCDNTADVVAGTSPSLIVEDIFTKEVRGSASWSHLHLVLGVLENCIQWRMTIERTKCKVCKSTGEKFQVICGWCRATFHGDCINPSLSKLPRYGQWFCSSCKNHPHANQLNKVPEIHLSAMEKLLKEFGLQKPVCCRSRTRDPATLIACFTCHKIYHKECHRPPLRNTPRGNWDCSKCSAYKKRY